MASLFLRISEKHNKKLCVLRMVKKLRDMILFVKLVFKLL